MPGKRGADDDDYVPPSGAARGAKKHPVSEAVLRFATEKKGAKAGPFVNKIFESSLEGAEQKVQQLEEADAASAEGAQPLSIIADLIDGREILVHHAHDLVPRHKSAALPCGQLAFGELFEQVKRALRKLARRTARPALGRRIFRLFRHLLQIFG